MGLRHQSPRVPLAPLTGVNKLVGRCRTTLWADMSHVDPNPYELELIAVDSCEPDDVIIAAAGGSMRSGIWGELLTTAAQNRGCVGAIVDGAIRDVDKMARLKFPIWAAAHVSTIRSIASAWSIWMCRSKSKASSSAAVIW